ncbi:MAG TPA: L-lysine 6-transaminase [Polyangiaceae bacterium]|nr:L-lysine 6-transaminase [Polyangiaceae bacterium]
MSVVPPPEVHSTLRRHLLATGHPIVLDLAGSHGDFAKDALSGDEYLDFAGFYGSNAVGFQHPRLRDPEMRERLALIASIKVGNPEFYTSELATFVATLERTVALPTHPHYFFVEGGALAVENAMKTAMDWKVRKNLARGSMGEVGHEILHFTKAFHGRAGYTLSVTNTDPAKTMYFPKFDWPRVPCPAARFPLEGENLVATQAAEAECLAAIERAFDERGHRIAAILIEPIQGEGGDNHFRAELLAALRRIADEREALLIFDEVQSGMGTTGRWWAHQHAAVVPDLLCFAKKLQVGGFFASRRIDDVDNVFKVPSRISSTWGGALLDMVRATRILEIIEAEGLVDNAAERGDELQRGLLALQAEFPEHISNVRGRGLMCALDLPDADSRTALLKSCFSQRLLVLPGGVRTLRFRPALSVEPGSVAEALRRLRHAVVAWRAT